MKHKLLVVCCILLMLATGLHADEMESLYSLVVPEQQTSLEVFGALGSTFLSSESNDLFRMEIGFAPGSFAIDLGGTARYYYDKQLIDQRLFIDGTGTVKLGTTEIGLNVAGRAGYADHSLKLGDLDAFYMVSGDVQLYPAYAFGSFGFEYEVSPAGTFGIGRIYSISTIKIIQLMMKHLNVVPTVDNVRAVAEIMYTNGSRLTRYTDNFLENYIAYYQDIANAMGIPDKALDICLINNSQVYTFESIRYLGLNHGWQAGVELAPFAKNNEWPYTNKLGFDLRLTGAWGTFLIEDSLYLSADGSIGMNLDSSATKKFAFITSVDATVRYLPENFRWWIDGGLRFGVNTRSTPVVDFQCDGEVDYLMSPNLRTYAGLSFSTLRGSLAFYAGGSYRIF